MARNIPNPSRFWIALITVVMLAVPGATHVAADGRAQGTRTLTILAASSLTEAFNAIKASFEMANPTVKIVYSFGASSILATQLREGAPADLFASASAAQMMVAVEAQRIAGRPRTFAKNRLVLAVPIDNPANVTSLKDLARPGLKLAVGRPKVPVRDYTDTMLAKLAKSPGYGDDYQAAVIKNFIEFDNVRQVSAQVASGEVDAGLVYQSDVTPDIAARVKVLPIPDAVNTLATYPIGITNDTPNPEAAQAFVDFVLSDAGQAILTRWSFISIRILPQPATITLAPGPAVQVRGQVLNPLTLTVEDLKANYITQVERVKVASGDQTVSAMFTGVLLRDVLDAAQINTDPDTPNDKLSLYIVATGRDGYQAVIAYAEIDPEFGAQPILIAYEQDGQPIVPNAHGPLRFIVPGDGRDGRYVGGLVSLDIRRGPTVSR